LRAQGHRSLFDRLDVGQSILIEALCDVIAGRGQREHSRKVRAVCGQRKRNRYCAVPSGALWTLWPWCTHCTGRAIISGWILRPCSTIRSGRPRCPIDAVSVCGPAGPCGPTGPIAPYALWSRCALWSCWTDWTNGPGRSCGPGLIGMTLQSFMITLSNPPCANSNVSNGATPSPDIGKAHGGAVGPSGARSAAGS
jgi:hypothetical protein